MASSHPLRRHCPHQRSTRRRRSALAAAAGFAALAVVAGCSDASGSPEPVASPSPSSPAASPSPSSEVTSADSSADELDASCRLRPRGPAGAPAVALAYPQGWDRGAQVDRPCRFFDPEPVGLPENAEADGVAVQWRVEPVAYVEGVEPDQGFATDERLPTVVDEHTAVRLTGNVTGGAGLPQGTDLVVWLIDVTGFGADADPATLVAAAHGDDPRAVEVLDRMVRAADIAPDAAPADIAPDAAPADAALDAAPTAGTTVARRTGGGTPFTVHHDRGTGCLALLAGTRQGRELAAACELGTPAPLTAVRLTEESHDLAVGLTSSDVDVVRLHTTGDTTRAVATVPIDGDRRAYALPLGGTEPTVVAETFDGRELGRRELGPSP